jgi:hypothetical protein
LVDFFGQTIKFLRAVFQLVIVADIEDGGNEENGNDEAEADGDELSGGAGDGREKVEQEGEGEEDEEESGEKEGDNEVDKAFVLEVFDHDFVIGGVFLEVGGGKFREGGFGFILVFY